MGKLPSVSIIVPTHNRQKKLIRLINSILESKYPLENMEILVIDDASTNRMYDLLKKKFDKLIKVLRIEHEVLPSKSRNVGADNSTGEYLFFVDDDCIVTPTTIKFLIEKAIYLGDNAGILAPIITYFNNPTKIWCAGGCFLPKSPFDCIHQYQDFKLISIQEKSEFIKISYSPSAFLIKREIFFEIGGFDHIQFPIAWEEIDLAVRVSKQGYNNVCVTKAVLIHDMEPNFRKENSKLRAYYHGRSRSIFYRKYLIRKIVNIPFCILGFIIQNKNIILSQAFFRGIVDGLTIPIVKSKL